MFLSLLKIRIQYMMNSAFSRGTAKQKKSGPMGKILMALLFIYVIGVLCFMMGMMFGALCEPFSELGLDWLYFAIAGIMAFALSFIGSVFMAKNQLYEANDNELLMSMPIKPSAILASRMAALMGMNILYQSIVLLPAIVMYIYYNGFSAALMIMFILGFILLPLFVITLTGIGGYLLQLIGSLLPKKNILEMLFYVLFLVAYFYFYSQIANYMTLLMQNGESIANAVRSSVFPAYCFGRAIADGSIIHIMYFALCSIIPMILMCWVLSKSYLKIMGTKRGAAKVKYKGGHLKAASIKSALLRREMMHFLNNPMYIMNAALGTICLIIVSAVLIIKKDAAVGFVPLFEMMGVPVPVVVSAAICAIASMNMISAPSVSIEGNSFWLIRSLPVDSGDILIAKAKCHFTATMPAALIAAIAAATALSIDAAGIILTIILPAVFIAFFAMLGVVINLQFPKMDWINEVYAIKQSAASIISMLSSMVMVAAPLLLYALVLRKYIDVQIYTVIVGLAVAAGDFIMYNYLRNGGKRRFEAI